MVKGRKIPGVLRYLGIVLLLGILLLPDAARVSAAQLKKSPYLIRINRYYNTVTIYEQEKDGEYSKAVKAMTCSVGSQARTLQGTFQLKEKYRWKLLMGDVYGQYATRIVGGILFHSVYYYENGNPASLATAQFNKLGQAASHGCIRLSVADAKWIYDNCATGTTVVIYDDKKSPGPLGKPETIKAKLGVGWDPTDPDDRNPYLADVPQIYGVKDVEVAWGSNVDVTKGVTAQAAAGKDLTKKLEIEGKVDTFVPGEYKVTYYVQDEVGRETMKVATYTVLESPEAPVFIGISDKIVGLEVKINKKFSLSGVDAYCTDKKMRKDLIDVTIDKVSEEEYRLIYIIKLGAKETKQAAIIHVDRNLPTIFGVADQYLTPNQIPDINTALVGVSVTDNYTQLQPSDIAVTISETPEGNYIVTYTASDEAGNTANAQAVFYKSIQ